MAADGRPCQTCVGLSLRLARWSSGKFLLDGGKSFLKNLVASSPEAGKGGLSLNVRKQADALQLAPIGVPHGLARERQRYATRHNECCNVAVGTCRGATNPNRAIGGLEE